MVDIFKVGIEGRTKSDAAYADLRRLLVTSAVGPYNDLEEAALARQLPHGRTPIREALKRLTHEGFLIWPPRHPPRPAPFDATAMQRLYETRLVLEESVARFAAVRITEEQLSGLAELCERIKRSVDHKETYEATEYDQAFHIAIAEGSHNSFMVEAIAHLNCAALPLWYKAHEVFGIDNSYEDHRNIVTALASHDPSAVAAAVTDHVRLSYARQLRLLELDLGDPLAQLPPRPTRPAQLADRP